MASLDDRNNKLIRILFIMVIQHGGDDVSCKRRIPRALTHHVTHYYTCVLKNGAVSQNMSDEQRLKEMLDEQIKQSKKSPKYLRSDCKTWKKSPSVWSFRDHQ